MSGAEWADGGGGVLGRPGNTPTRNRAQLTSY
jgi:hypothetical protein